MVRRTLLVFTCVAACGLASAQQGPPPGPKPDVPLWKVPVTPPIDAGLDLPLEAPPTYDPQAANAKDPGASDPPGSDEGEDQPRDTPPPKFFGEELDAENASIVYVIDRSWSMSNRVQEFVDEDGERVTNGSRFDRARAELKTSIASLPDNFKFNVIFYDHCVHPLWSRVQDANPGNKAQAMQWADSQSPNRYGWTNSGLAVATALADKAVSGVVLLSDGSPNYIDCAKYEKVSPTAHRRLIVQTNTQAAVVDTFGIGLSHSSVARPFMRQVAQESQGRFVEVE